MEIYNRVSASSFENIKLHNKKKNPKSNVSFGNNIEASSANALESIAKAKIQMDREYTKPIPYEEKIKILKEKQIPEEKFELFLSQDDETFKEMIEYVNLGITTDEIKSIYGQIWGNGAYKEAADLSKYGIPFNFGKDLYSFSSVPEDKIEFLKKAGFDFSSNKRNFKIDTYLLKNVLKKEDYFEKFNSIYKKGVDANVALASVNLNDERFQSLEKLLEEEKEINNSAAAAYFLSNFAPEEIQKIIDMSKSYSLDCNDYDFWINAYNNRGFENAEELMQFGLPADYVQKNISLNNSQLKEAVSFSQENGISLDDSIVLYTYYPNDEQKRNNSCSIIKENNLDASYACRLSNFDENIIDSAILYLKRGIDFNKAISIAQIKKDDAYKERVIGLSDVFENISDAETYLNMNLSEEDSAKFIDLVKKGANIYFASFCIQSPATYAKAMSLLESGKCDSLEGLYGGFNEEEVIKELDYIGYGVPKDYVSMFLCSATDEESELLKDGVLYETLKPLQEFEEQGNDSTLLKKYLKKGIPFKTAVNLVGNPKVKEIPQEVLFDSIHPSLDAKKIIFLAKLQQNGLNDKFSEKDKDILIEFLSLVNDTENIEDFIDLGFINEKALENYKELKKRGISSDNTIIISQLDFKDPLQIDRAAELLKRKIPFESILFSINDDKSFMDSIRNNKNNNSFSYENLRLNSCLVKLYKSGMKKEDIDLIKKEMLYSGKSELDSLIKYVGRGHNLKDAINISKFHFYKTNFISSNREDEKENEKEKEWLSSYILKGCSFDALNSIISNEKKKKELESFIKAGIGPNLAEKLVLYDINPDDEDKISKIKCLESSNINENLKKISGNPLLYPFIDEMFNFQNFSTYQYGQLLKSDISMQDIFESGKIFVKSPLKLAMKRPNLYLSGIPIEDTEKVDGKYPELSDYKIQSYRNKMLYFFKSNLVEITRALKYLDVDTFNQLMDKRTNNFSEQLEMLNKMDDKHYELVSKITKCRKTDGKLLSSKEKIDLAKIILYHQLGYLDTSYIEECIQDGKVDIQALRSILYDKLFETIGLTPEEVKENSDKLNFDEDYLFLLLRTQKSADFMWIKEALDDKKEIERVISTLEELLATPEELAHNGLTVDKAEALIDLLKRADKMEEKEVYKEFSEISPFSSVDVTAQDIARIAVTEDFNSYIQEISNSFGEANLKTKLQFEKLGLDYDKWLNFSETEPIELNNHSYNIKLWDRNPQKDLFMGNRTSCCTAVIDGANGKATPIYLSNTAFNVIELTDENGNIVGMSRIFVGIVDEKPSIIIENIELNNAFIKDKTQEELKFLRDNIFGYIANFASEISDKEEMNIYFSKNYTHVPTDDFELERKNIDFAGTLSSSNIYLNCKPGWTTPQELKEQPCELYKIW